MGLLRRQAERGEFLSTAYLVLSLVVGPLIGGGLVYWIQSRIRINEARANAGIQSEVAATSTPYAVLMQQIQAKDAQLASSEQYNRDFVAAQMKRNDAETQAILALAEQVRMQTENQKDISSALHDHRAESSARAGKIYEQIGKVNERLAGLEASLRISIETAKEAANTAKEAAENAKKAVVAAGA